MKYLIIDDMPADLKLLKRALIKAENTVNIAQNLGVGWQRIEHERNNGNPFDLVVLDLALDIGSHEFTEENAIIKDALAGHHHGDLPASGQTLGLRLWHRRKELQQRYCYMTHHQYLWISKLTQEDPEFEEQEVYGNTKAIPERISGLILEKSDLWPDNVAGKFRNAWRVWEDSEWLR
nr:MAG: hypothetical protein BECKLFY1418B_GA0070995_100522 [Candidatus Kentron sp. LFY]VFJ90431.1 MAG: hypothetical protein BECKLFY1418A_GA0070994_101144 [Candidatus Kentron sp. LFY]